jgi:hypothetical protein
MVAITFWYIVARPTIPEGRVRSPRMRLGYTRPLMSFSSDLAHYKGFGEPKSYQKFMIPMRWITRVRYAQIHSDKVVCHISSTIRVYLNMSDTAATASTIALKNCASNYLYVMFRPCKWVQMTRLEIIINMYYKLRPILNVFYKFVNIWNLAVALNYLFLGGSFALSLWISKFGVENLYRKNKTRSETKIDSRWYGNRFSIKCSRLHLIDRDSSFPDYVRPFGFSIQKKIQLKNFLKATIRTIWLYCCSYSPKVIPDPCTTPRCTK